jgi:phage N-6-adenine-methyltransferase
MFSAVRPDWETPPELYASLAKRFGPFDLDAAATAANAKCPRFLSPEVDGRNPSLWFGRVWCNPPYGRGIKDWILTAARAVLLPPTLSATLLLPARTDTRWFHDALKAGAKAHFLQGRVKFVGAKSGAPFPSLVLHFAKP